ncbi:MAG: hypothetical protein EOM55_04240 [Clostridia bacterium]|nr:hypothetical protein [Clostridia bacterium]
MEQKRIANMQLNHLGIILSNLSIVGFLLMLGALLSFLLYGLIVVIMIIPVLFTLGLYLFAHPDYFSWLSADSGFFEFMTRFINYIPTIGICTVVASAISIVCLSFYKGQKSWWRIVLCGIIVVLALLVAFGIIGA